MPSKKPWRSLTLWGWAFAFVAFAMVWFGVDGRVSGDSETMRQLVGTLQALLAAAGFICVPVGRFLATTTVRF